VFADNVVMNYMTINNSCTTDTCDILENKTASETSMVEHLAVTGYTIDDLGVEVFKLINPDQPLVFNDDNDNSIVIKMSYKNVSFLFTGDCEEKCENMLLLLDRDVSANILKVGHHGGSTATTPQFYAKVHPAYAVLSYGDPNAYGHPTQEVVDRLVAGNTKIVRTATAGTIEVRTDGTAVEFFCEKKADCFAG
jgi:competence protein ComEC